MSHNIRLEKRIQHRIVRTSERLVTPTSSFSAAGHEADGDTRGELAIHHLVRELAATRELNVVLATLKEMLRLEVARRNDLLTSINTSKMRLDAAPVCDVMPMDPSIHQAKGAVKGRARTLETWVDWIETTFVDALHYQHDIKTNDDLAYELAQPVRR